MIALPLSPDIETRLDELARRTGRSKASLAEEAILEHLENLEDLHLAERRLDELRRGETKTVPLAELMARHGLED